jgi:hypothetical protein
MRKRWTWIAVFIAVALLVVAGVAWGDEQSPVKAGGYPGGHLRFAYRTETGSAGLSETTTTDITPTVDGRYQVVTTTTELTNPDEIRLGFFGISLKWLGLYMSEDTSDQLDISQLDAFATMVLEPHKTYMLPDGGKLQTGDRVTVAGLPGIEGVYTQANVAGVTITVVLADDLFVRQFLPFPLRVQLEYSQPADADPGIVPVYVSGKIELVEYTWIPEKENAP